MRHQAVQQRRAAARRIFVQAAVIRASTDTMKLMVKGGSGSINLEAPDDDMLEMLRSAIFDGKLRFTITVPRDELNALFDRAVELVTP